MLRTLERDLEAKLNDIGRQLGTKLEFRAESLRPEAKLLTLSSFKIPLFRPWGSLSGWK